MEKQAEQQEIVYDANQMVVVRKANEFVNAAYRFGNNDVLCQQLIVISLTRLQKEGSQLKSVLYPAEIKKLMGRMSDTNIYRRLKNATAGLAGHVITIEDVEHLHFRTFSLITNAEYENGRLQIYYNKEITPYIYNLKKGYTKYELGVLCALDRSSSFRLYELLEKEAYLFRAKGTQVITKTYNLSELKSKIGLVNTDQPYIKKMVADGKTWDEILEHTKKEDQMYTNWTDFRKRVLEPARQELKEKTDIAFDYDPVRGDRGGRVLAVRFSLRRNTPTKAQRLVLDTDGMKKDGTSAVSARIMNEAQAYYEAQQILEDAGYLGVSDFTPEYFDQIFERCGRKMEVLQKLAEAAAQLKVRDKWLCSWMMQSVEANAGAESETTEEEVEVETEDSQSDNGYSEIRGYLKRSGVKALGSFTEDYFENLLADADGSLARIEAAIDYGKKQKRIRNYFGWLRKAVRENYAETEKVEVENGNTDDAEFSQNMRASVNDEIKQKVWTRLKTKDSFAAFLQATGLDLHVLEETFSLDERISMFSDYLQKCGTQES